MRLLSATLRYLHAGLLAQLAQASEISEAEAFPFADAAATALVRQLSQPTDLGEQNARWDMCRQLYLSQLLTNSEELLRTDLGWPDRRRYLTEKLLGATQVTSLVGTSATPAAATRLLGYLTILLLAIVGEHASQDNLDPAGLGQWLRQQEIEAPATSAPHPAPAAPGTKPPAAKPAAKTAPAATPAPTRAQPALAKRSPKLVAGLASVVLLVGLGGYLVAGRASTATPDVPVAEAPAVVAAPTGPAPALPAAAEPAPLPVAEPVAAPLATPETKKTAVKAPAGPVLRDTIGNASAALTIGGRFNASQGRYLKGEGQPLVIKLINRATLTVGINSTESLLYKRLTNPALPRPSDLVLDRLTFDNGRANLGAEGAQQLGSVASLLKTFPKVRVLVLGHANPGELDANKLGLKRATAAVEELQKQGIAASRLQAQGAMATGIPTDNDSAERQAMLQGISLKLSRL